jgi:hypothetical protein
MLDDDDDRLDGRPNIFFLYSRYSTIRSSRLIDPPNDLTTRLNASSEYLYFSTRNIKISMGTNHNLLQEVSFQGQNMAWLPRSVSLHAWLDAKRPILRSLRCLRSGTEFQLRRLQRRLRLPRRKLSMRAASGRNVTSEAKDAKCLFGFGDLHCGDDA